MDCLLTGVRKLLGENEHVGLRSQDFNHSSSNAEIRFWYDWSNRLTQTQSPRASHLCSNISQYRTTRYGPNTHEHHCIHCSVGSSQRTWRSVQRSVATPSSR